MQRDTLDAWRRFFAAHSQVLIWRPGLTFQLAANDPDHSPVCRAAANRLASKLDTRPWLHHLNKSDLPGACRATMTGAGEVTCCAISANGAHVLSGSSDGTVRLWRADTGESVATLTGHRGRVTGCEFSPDCRMALSSAADGVVILWSIDQPRERHRLRGDPGAVRWLGPLAARRASVPESPPPPARIASPGHGGPALLVTRTAVSPGGTGVAAAMRYQSHRFASNAAPIQIEGTGITLNGHVGEVTAMEFLDDRRLVSASFDRSIRLWDVRQGREIARWGWQAGHVTAMAASADQRILVTGSSDGTVRIWDLVEAEKAGLTDPAAAHADPGSPVFAGAITSCCAAPDGSGYLTASTDGALRVWNPDGSGPVGMLTGHTARIDACAWSALGQGASISEDQSVRLWDLEACREIAVLGSHAGSLFCCAFSRDGWLLASASETVRVWDLSTGELRHQLDGHADQVTGLAFLPDGRRLVSASWDGCLIVWDLDTGQLMRRIEGDGTRVLACAISADGAACAAAREDGAIDVWDPLGGGLRWRAGGEGQPVHACAISPDGSRVAAVSAGPEGKYGARPGRPWTAGVLTVWAPDVARPVAVFPSDRGITAVVWPAWDTLAVGTAGGTLELLRLEHVGVPAAGGPPARGTPGARH